MPRHATRTSYKPGRLRPPEEAAKQSATLRRLYAEGTFQPPRRPWTAEQRERHGRTKRAKVLGKTYLVHPGGVPYRMVMTEAGRRYEHRVVMEKTLGRSLERSDVVHHINHDTLDNRPENLMLTTWSGHNHLHPDRDVRHLVVAAKAKRLEGRWSLRYERCIDCKSTRLVHAAGGRCRTCYSKFKGYGRKPP